jgi:hypothetical protein
METTTRRKAGHKEKVTKPAPAVAVDYNKCMGAVDRFNHLMESYSCRQVHQHRWFTALIYFGLDVLMINAYIKLNEERRLQGEKAITSKIFRRLAIDHLCMTGNAGTPKATAAAAADPAAGAAAAPASTQLPPSHLPARTGDRARCRQCAAGQSFWYCRVCKVNLCLNKDRNCYTDYHIQQQLM